MNCERATLVVLLREAEADLRIARTRTAVAPRVAAARRLHDAEVELTDWDRRYSERLRRGEGRDCH